MQTVFESHYDSRSHVLIGYCVLAAGFMAVGGFIAGAVMILKFLR
jgi:hypothetical protein